MNRFRVLALCALTVFAACRPDVSVTNIIETDGDGQSDTTKTHPSSDTLKVVSMRISPQEAKMKVGDTLTFSAVCRNVNGNVVSCTSTSWRSNNNLVAEMVGGGRILAKSVGITTVCGMISSAVDSCAVVIIESVAPAYKIYGVFPNPTAVTLANGSCGQQTQQLTATLVGDGPFPTAVRWSSLNPTIVTVDSLGLAMARGAGAASIKVVAVGDTTKFNVVYVTVNACTVQADTTITLKPDSVNVVSGVAQQTTAECRVNGVVFPCGKPWWYSHNPSIALVDPWTGLVRGLQKGVTNICVQFSRTQMYPRKCIPVVIR